MMLDDPAAVRREYATEQGLADRAAAYENVEGPNPNDVALEAVVDVRPARVLEVGCGWGAFAERVQRELGIGVVAIDQSERMVELARERGVEARVGDVQLLPFPDGQFDVAVANWMLYHVPDLDRALRELARVLRPGGRLVAVTNGTDHLQELYDLLGVDRRPSSFNAENGGDLLRAHFSRVERREATGWVIFPDRAAAQARVDATQTLRASRPEVPPFEGALRVRRSPYVFVAER